MLLPGRAFPVTETLQGELVGGDRGHGQVSFDRCCTFRRQCGYSALPVGQLYCAGTCSSEQAFNCLNKRDALFRSAPSGGDGFFREAILSFISWDGSGAGPS
jgi:hypothetical protein